MQKLPTTVRQLGWVSFFADVASELAYPILPLFIVGTLAAPTWTVGFIEGMAMLCLAFLRLYSGAKSDQTGKRTPFIRWGYGLSIIAKPLVGLATSWGLVLFARMLDRLGKGLRTTARDALIADSVDPAIAGRAFGFHRAMDTAGAFVGVSIGIVLLSFFPENLRLILLLSGIPGFFALWITFRVKDAPSSGARASGVKLGSLPRKAWIPLAILAVFAFANTSDAFLLLFARALGFDTRTTVALYALFNLVYAVGSYPLGKLSDRLGARTILGLGWVLYGLVYFAFSSLSKAFIPLLFAGYGLCMAAVDGVGKAYLVRVIPTQLKGTVMGWSYLLTGLASLSGSLLTGLLWDRIGPSITFQISGAVAIVAALLLQVAGRAPQSQPQLDGA